MTPCWTPLLLLAHVVSLGLAVPLDLQDKVSKAVATGASSGIIRRQRRSDASIEVAADGQLEAVRGLQTDGDSWRKLGATYVEGAPFANSALQMKAIARTKWMTATNTTLKVDAQSISLFCFAWTARRSGEEAILPELKKQFAKCDGSAIFTDEEAEGTDDGIVKVHVVPQQKYGKHIPRSSREPPWLYHRNMAGLIPAWNYLLENKIADKYDWILNTEFDHYIRPSQVRLNIAQYMVNLWEGTPSEQGNVGKPMMLMWGNAFVFNNEMVGEMRRQWSVLGKVAGPESPGSGCPDWMKGQLFYPDDCSQDIVYPIMAMIMKPRISAIGAAGCGQQPRNHRGVKFPLPCYQMSQNPMGGANGEEAEQKAIRAIAAKKPEKEASTSLTATSHRMMMLVQTDEVHTDSGEGAEVGVVQGHTQVDEVNTKQTQIEKTQVSERHAGEEQGSTAASAGMSAYAARVDRLITAAEAIAETEKGNKDHTSESSDIGSTLVEQLRRFRSALSREASDSSWDLYIPDWHVPIIHECKWVAVHKLAREMLGF